MRALPRLHVPAAGSDLATARSEPDVLGVCSGLRRLDEHGPQPDAAFLAATAALTARAHVIAGGQAHPSGEGGGRGEAAEGKRYRVVQIYATTGGNVSAPVRTWPGAAK